MPAWYFLNDLLVSINWADHYTMSITNQQVLRLYKSLLKYGNQLQLTDKWYYINRVRGEFKANKSLKTAEQIEFSFKVNVTVYLTISVNERLANVLFISERWSRLKKQTNHLRQMLRRSFLFLRRSTQTNNLRLFTSKPTAIDFTRVPKLNDEDLEEQFVRGSGPGR